MNTVEFVKTIREISMQVINSLKPAKIMYGKVKSINPFEIFVDQRFNLTEDFLIIPKHLRSEYNICDYEGRKISVDNSIKTGDKVAVIRDDGGQRFLIVGVIDSDTADSD